MNEVNYENRLTDFIILSEYNVNDVGLFKK
jgi:hypothetical protein